MSIEAVARALNLIDARLSAVDRLVFIGIANHDGDGGSWPSIATLARYAGVEPRSARRSVARLVDFGLVVRELGEGGTKATKDHQRPNLYHLIFDESGEDPGVRGGRTEQSGEGRTQESSEPSREPSVEPSTLPVPTTTPMFVVDDVFESFWKLYPRKASKPAARRAFSAALKREPNLTVIAQGLRRWVDHWQIDGRAQFIPHPATWLNGDRWNDEPVVETGPKSKTGSALDAMRRRAEESEPA